jgi:hypothetical protein
MKPLGERKREREREREREKLPSRTYIPVGTSININKI